MQQIFLQNTKSGEKRGLLANRYLGCIKISFPVVLQLPRTMYFFPFKQGANLSSKGAGFLPLEGCRETQRSFLCPTEVTVYLHLHYYTLSVDVVGLLWDLGQRQCWLLLQVLSQAGSESVLKEVAGFGVTWQSCTVPGTNWFRVWFLLSLVVFWQDRW